MRSEGEAAGDAPWSHVRALNPSSNTPRAPTAQNDAPESPNAPPAVNQGNPTGVTVDRSDPTKVAAVNGTGKACDKEEGLMAAGHESSMNGLSMERNWSPSPDREIPDRVTPTCPRRPQQHRASTASTVMATGDWAGEMRDDIPATVELDASSPAADDNANGAKVNGEIVNGTADEDN